MCILVHTFEYKLQITNQIIDLLDIYFIRKKTGHKVSFLKVFINLNIHVCSKLRYDRMLLPVYNTIR